MLILIRVVFWLCGVILKVRCFLSRLIIWLLLLIWGIFPGLWYAWYWRKAWCSACFRIICAWWAQIITMNIFWEMAVIMIFFVWLTLTIFLDPSPSVIVFYYSQTEFTHLLWLAGANFQGQAYFDGSYCYFVAVIEFGIVGLSFAPQGSSGLK